ncbi:hypothetical protein FXO37_18119 [Capsicum annuum]|nr:hypothetical protein FXO37_18119 [Capsicum annuum]
MIPIDQIKDFITRIIKVKYEVAAKSFLTYAKPYTIRIDNMKMPFSYQPYNFSSSTVREIRRSMLHTSLKHGTTLERVKPNTFEELATRAHNIELSMPLVGKEGPPFHEPRKGYGEKGIHDVNLPGMIKFKDSETIIEIELLYPSTLSNATSIKGESSKEDGEADNSNDWVLTFAKVASKKDLKLADTNTMPDVNVVKKRKMPVIYYVPKDNKDEGHPLKRQGNSLERPTHPIKQIDTIKSSAKLFGKFVAPASLESDTFPTIRSDKCFNPNTYKVLAKVGYDPNET